MKVDITRKESDIIKIRAIIKKKKKCYHSFKKVI